MHSKETRDSIMARCETISEVLSKGLVVMEEIGGTAPSGQGLVSKTLESDHGKISMILQSLERIDAQARHLLEGFSSLAMVLG